MGKRLSAQQGRGIVFVWLWIPIRQTRVSWARIMIWVDFDLYCLYLDSIHLDSPPSLPWLRCTFASQGLFPHCDSNHYLELICAPLNNTQLHVHTKITANVWRVLVLGELAKLGNLFKKGADPRVARQFSSASYACFERPNLKAPSARRAQLQRRRVQQTKPTLWWS